MAATALEATRSAKRICAPLDQAIPSTRAPLEVFTPLGRPTRPLSADRRAFRAALASQHRELAAKPAAEEGCETGAAGGAPTSRLTRSFFSIVPRAVLGSLGLPTMVTVRLMPAAWRRTWETRGRRSCAATIDPQGWSVTNQLCLRHRPHKISPKELRPRERTT